MTKRRLLGVLAILVLLNLIMVNQNWLTANAGESQTPIELAGTKVSHLVSPILIVVVLTVFVGSYLSGKATSILLLVEAALVAAGILPLISALANPGATIAGSGQVEKITGLTGTTSEITSQLSALSISPSFAISIATLVVLALWMTVTAVFAWRWKKVARVYKGNIAKSESKNSRKKAAKSSFDLWDSQR